MNQARPGAAARPALSGALGFVLRALPMMAVFYAAIYVPHAPDGIMARLLGGYLEWVARASGWLIGIFDPSLTVQGRSLAGRFPLEIVLDCGALDVLAIFAAAVIAFPAPWRRRALGLAAGIPALLLLNLARIVCLYFVGALAPRWFHVLHEEVFQIVIVLGACAGFSCWALWAKNSHPTGPTPIPGVPVVAA